MVEVIVITVGQFVADNSTFFAYIFSIGCLVGGWHLSKDKS